jgi:hypothetical protein
MDKLYISNIDELKLLLSTMNAEPTPGYCSSFGWYWHTINYNNSDIIIITTTNHEDKSFNLSIYDDENKDSDILSYMSQIYETKNYTGNGIVKDNSWSCPKGFQPASKEKINKVKEILGTEVSSIIGLN